MNALAGFVLATMVAFAASQRTRQAVDLNTAISNVFSFQAGPETLCRPFCTTNCGVVRSTCFDVAGLISCDQILQNCNAACNDLCGCYEACPNDCNENCQNIDGLGQILCQTRQLACISICSSQCPANAYASTTLRALNSVVSSLMLILTPQQPSGQ